MKEIRTTFYDLRGYFIPGSIMLWALLELLDLTGYSPSTRVISTMSPSMRAVLFVVIAYAIGHGLHAIANFTIDKLPFASYPPKDYFDGKYQEDFPPDIADSLFMAVAGMLSIQNPVAANAEKIIKSTYWPCFQYVMNCQNVETENFLGLNGFYRGMTAAMLVTTVLYAGAFLMFCRGQLGIIVLCALLAGVLFLTRARRFNYYLAKTVYANFLHLYNEKKQDSLK